MGLLSDGKRLEYEKDLARFKAVEALLGRRDCTYLGVGPMSKNCVDACIELTEEYGVPLMLIASRRQVECLELGGGYVNNWDTLSFANYVRRRDRRGLIVLARDHGGPFQHPVEVQKCATIEDAMESAMLSYQRDIEAGFQIIHIDPVISQGSGEPDEEWILDKVFRLYAFCMEKARELGRDIHFEIGTEEQKQNPLKDIRKLEYVIGRIKEFCSERGYPFPTFLVVQTGTKVMETRNIGKFPSAESEIPTYLAESRIEDFVGLCEKYGLKIKEHNTDYLSDASLRVHPGIGIHAANVAPEFGVAETRAFMGLLRDRGLDAELEEFVRIAHDSGKWDKWVIDASALTRSQKAEICGHYVFSTDAFRALKESVTEKLARAGLDLDRELTNAVKASILRYLKCFNLVGGVG